VLHLRLTIILGILGLLHDPALAQPKIDFFHPLLTRRAIIEREIEVQLRHHDGRAGRETTMPIALDLPVLPRWQIELGLPLIVTDLRDRDSTIGPGDLVLENKFKLVESAETRTVLSVGFDIGMPTGSARRRLGGNTSITPFVATGVKLGRLDVQADAGYTWSFATQGSAPDEQTMVTNIAVGTPLRPWLIPFVEATTVSRVTGGEKDGDVRLLGRPQIYLTPGINLDILPRATWLIGVEFPVTSARTFDYRVIAGVVWNF